MGNRAVVVFYSNNEYSPYTYLHWNGSQVPELLSECAKYMIGRSGDLSYTAARFVGICHDKIKGNLSLGIGNVGKIVHLSDLEEYCPGDAGVFAVDISKPAWAVTRLSGSYTECNAPDKWTIEHGHQDV